MQKSLSGRQLASLKRSLGFFTATFLIFGLLLLAPSVSAALSLFGWLGSDEAEKIAESGAKESDKDSNKATSNKPSDKVVVIEEYMSLTCPHCATFHREIYPELARSVLKSEHVSYQYRDFPLDRVALAGAILSRCGGDALRGKIVGAMMERQDRLLSAAEPLSVFLGILQLVGIDEPRARACLQDKSLERAVLEEQLEGKRLHTISSTPTIIVAGKKITGRLSAKKIIKAVDAALRRAGLPAR